MLQEERRVSAPMAIKVDELLLTRLLVMLGLL